MPLLTDLALMMRIDQLALIFGLREFVTVVYGPTVVQVFPDIRVEAYRHSVMYVNIVSVVDCPGWVLMDLKNSFKCRMGGEDFANVQFNPKLWNLRPIIRETTDAVKLPAWPETYAYVRENQDAWLAGLNPLPNRCPLYPRIRRMLCGVNSPVLAPRIGAAQDVEEKNDQVERGMEPRFISWKAAALHVFNFDFQNLWSSKKIKAIPSRKPEVSAGHWNDVYTPADDKSRLQWPRRETVVIMEVSKETRGDIYLTTEAVAPHGEEPVKIVMNDQVFYHAVDLAIPARPDAGIDMRHGPSGPGPRPDNGGDANKENHGENDPMEGKSD